MSDLPASASIGSDKSDESTDSYVEPVLCVLGSDGQIIDTKNEDDESLVYNILVQASKSRKSIVDTLHHHNRHLSFQSKTLRKNSLFSRPSSKELTVDDDDDLLFVTKKSVHNINAKSVSALSLPRVSAGTSRGASAVAVEETAYNRFEELEESRFLKKKARKVKILAENDEASMTSSQREKPDLLRREKVVQSYVYDPGQQASGTTSRTPDDEQQFPNLRGGFLDQQKEPPPFRQQMVQQKDRTSASRALARDRDRSRDREIDLLGTTIAEKRPKRTVASEQKAIELDSLDSKRETPQQLKVTSKQKSSDIKLPGSKTPEDTQQSKTIPGGFLEEKKEPSPFRQQMVQQKDRVGPSTSMTRGRGREVDLQRAKVSENEPKGVVESKLSKQKGVDRDPFDLKPRESPQQLKGTFKQKSSDIKLPGSKTSEDTQQPRTVPGGFLEEKKEPSPFRQQMVQQKDRDGSSTPMARGRGRGVDLLETKISDKEPKEVIEKKPSKQKGVERDPFDLKPRESPQQLKGTSKQKSSDIKLLGSKTPEDTQQLRTVPGGFLEEKKEPPPFRQQMIQQKDRAGPSTATTKDRGQEVDLLGTKITDKEPKGVVEKKPSKQKEVERDTFGLKPRESPQKFKEISKRKPSDIKLPSPKTPEKQLATLDREVDVLGTKALDTKLKGVVEKKPSKLKGVEREFVSVKPRESPQRISKKISSDIKVVKRADERDVVKVKARESPQQVKELSEPYVKSQSVKSVPVSVKTSEREASDVLLQKFDDVNVKVEKSKNKEFDKRLIKAKETDDDDIKRVWKRPHGTLEEGDAPLAESTTYPASHDISKIDDSDKTPRVQVDFNASVLESKDVNYLSRLPIMTKSEQPYVPVLYTFRVKPKDKRKLEHLTTQAPPFYVLLDHTIAVIWTLFNANANKEGLGISQLQWALYFLQQIHNVDGVPPKDVNLCIETIQEYLIDGYSDISEESVMYGGACLGDYVRADEKEIPFSLNYSQMAEKSVAKEDEEPLKTLDKELLEEFENVKRLVGIESIDLTTAISRDKTIMALTDWKREQMDKIQDELRLLRTVEDMMKSVDDTLVDTNDDDELTLLFKASKKT